MNDTSIIALYWKRDERAVKETDKKYGKLCYRLADNILKRREDAEECVNDTYQRVWDSIPDDRPDHFTAYICQIVKRLAISRYRHDTASKRRYDAYLPYDELAEVVSGKDDPEDAHIIAEMSDAISDWLMTESKRSRIMFVRRYWYYDTAEQIADMLHISPATVWSTLSRMRKRLKEYLQKEGYDI
ncbi:MAG: RNA polymerase sigma factor [Oscillospiraceae bacterium]|nr:RNA polymerase sigma factor [Oscillospiraceae bacterium]